MRTRGGLRQSGLGSDLRPKHTAHHASNDTAFDASGHLALNALFRNRIHRFRLGHRLLDTLGFLGDGLCLHRGFLGALGNAARDEAHGEEGASPAGQATQRGRGHGGSAVEGMRLERTTPSFGLQLRAGFKSSMKIPGIPLGSPFHGAFRQPFL
jgi:hypothetical protein